MSRHQKVFSQKQKMLIYISSAAIAVLAALILVIVLIHTVNNPPPVIFQSINGSSASLSNLSEFKNSSSIFIPEPVITITPEGNDQKIDEIIDVVEQVKPNTQNSVVVKETTIDTSHLTKRSVKLDVKYLPQNPELPTGCEITSLTTVLNYLGYDVSKTDMAKNYLEKSIDKIDDFWEVFVGDPTKNGFGCYAKPIVKAANRYLATQGDKYKAVNYSGTKFEDLLTLVQDGTPVIIWSTMYGEKENDLRKPFTTVKWNINGKNIQWIAPEHCMVLIGYDIDRGVAIMSDPQRGIVEYNLETVKSRYLALHSQCVVLELKPVINGIENGAYYYTTQYVTVTSNNLKSVTVNGEEVETGFFIDGNAFNMYEIQVTDNDNNVITYIVYTKKIDSLAEPIQNFSSNTVTIDDTNTIKNVRNTILNLSTNYSPPSESAAINEIVTMCDSLLNKISDVQAKFKRVKQTYNVYLSYTEDKPDSESVISLKESINDILGTQNLTSSQRTELTKMITQCNNWLNDTSSETQTNSSLQ